MVLEVEFLAPKLHWVLGGGHRVEGHADGKSKLRPGFLVTDRPPMPRSQSPLEEEAGLQ